MIRTDLEESFIIAFGEEQFAKIIEAAEGHRDALLEGNKRSPEPIADAIIICIGHDCLTNAAYREHHGITAPEADLRDWSRLHLSSLHNHGPLDYIALFAGAYNGWFTDGENA